VVACFAPIAAGIARSAHAEGGWLGAIVMDLTRESATARSFEGTGGVLLAGVIPKGPMAAAGFQSGDIILAVDGRGVARAKVLIALVSARDPGQEVDVVAVRDGKPFSKPAVLADRAARLSALPSNEILQTRYKAAIESYENGDLTDSVRRLRELADLGLPGARYSLGYLHETGESVPRDLAEAARLYRLAAETGVPDAQFRLGMLYQRGGTFQRDALRAYYWLSKVADDNEEAALTRDAVVASMTVGEIAKAEQFAELLTEPWQPPSVANTPTSSKSTISRGEVREIQRLLDLLGYRPGPADGIAGTQTQVAITKFQVDQDLLVDANPSTDLLHRLRRVAANAGVAAGTTATKTAAPSDGLGDIGDLDDF